MPASGAGKVRSAGTVTGAERLKSQVFMSDMRATMEENLLDKVGRLFGAVGAAGAIAEGDFVAVKIHVGEPGNTAYVSPLIVSRIVGEIKKAGGIPFLTDSNTLYVGQRSNAVSHMRAASANGFNLLMVDAPFIVADGLHGHDFRSLAVPGGGILKEAKIGSAVAQADALVVVSHVKGHMGTGMGATLKNIGMGCASRAGKQIQHSSVKPTVSEKDCVACGRCTKWCPTGAIRVEGGHACIDQELCIGCGECTAACKTEAVAIRWGDGERAGFCKRVSEYAAAVIADKKGKCAFFNVIINVAPDCDCASSADAAVIPDLGILASLDPVAVEQAAGDLVRRAPVVPTPSVLSGKVTGDGRDTDKFKAIHPRTSWEIQVEHAERLGLGSRQYNLVKVG